jgi:hypothetical protein
MLVHYLLRSSKIIIVITIKILIYTIRILLIEILGIIFLNIICFGIRHYKCMLSLKRVKSLKNDNDKKNSKTYYYVFHNYCSLITA